VSQFSSFPVVRNFQWLGCFSALNFAGIQQSFSIFIEWGDLLQQGYGTLMHPLTRGNAHGAVPRCRRRLGVDAESAEGAMAQQKLIT